MNTIQSWFDRYKNQPLRKIPQKMGREWLHRTSRWCLRNHTHAGLILRHACSDYLADMNGMGRTYSRR
ncbi:MAG: hypothetical protein DMG47_22355 [Acidobacteria bacterium]|nr:MAG: hypothetical protein DMG47_22355 [Acidobacteriota bacterium]